MKKIALIAVLGIWGVLCGTSQTWAADYYMTGNYTPQTGWSTTWTPIGTGTAYTGVPTAGNNYYIGNLQGVAEESDANQGTLFATSGTFAGDALYIGVKPDGTLGKLGSNMTDPNSSILLSGENPTSGKSLTVANLVLGSGGIASYSDSYARLDGKITVMEGANALFRCWASDAARTLNIDSSITGGEDATINVFTYNPGTSKQTCIVSINNANNTYTGSWTLTEKSILTANAVNALGANTTVDLSGENSVLNVKANQSFSSLTMDTTAKVVLHGAVTATMNGVTLSNGTIRSEGSASSTLEGTLKIADGATVTLERNSTASSRLFVDAALTDGKDAVIHVNTSGTSDNRVTILSANNTFTGTWNVSAGSFLYLGEWGSITDNHNGLGVGSSITMAENSKVVLFANQELKDVTITGSGTTFTPANAKVGRITGTLTTDGTKINASIDGGKLNVLAGGDGEGTSKTAYINSIQKYSPSGQADFYLGYGTNQYGNLYVNTIGSSAEGMGMNLVHAVGTLGAYSDTGSQTIQIYGDYTASGTGTKSLNLDIAGGQNLSVSGNVSITNLTLNATTTTALDLRKPYKVFSAGGTATGLGNVTLGANLTSYGTEVVGGALYVGTEDSLHTYYTQITGITNDARNVAWNRFGMGSATKTGLDADGLYYVTWKKNQSGTTTVNLELGSGSYTFGGKALYVGYDVDTGEMLDSYGTHVNTTNATLRLSGKVTIGDLYLGKGGIYVNDGTNVLSGNLHVLEGADSVIRLNSSLNGQRIFEIASAIDGSGTLNLAGRTSSQNNAYKTNARVNVSNVNNTFTGTWNVLNDTALFATKDNALGDGATLILNTGTLYDTGATVGNSKAFLTADQNLARVTVKAADSVLMVGSMTQGNSVTLTTPNLDLSNSFTFGDVLYNNENGSSTQYRAGVLAAETISNLSTGEITLTLNEGTLKTETIGTAGNKISIVQNDGVLGGFDENTTEISLFGDYEQTGGTLRLALGRESLLVSGDLDLNSIELFGDEGFAPQEGETYNLLSWTGTSSVNLEDLLITLDSSLQGYALAFGMEGNTLYAVGTPEPASWLLLLSLVGGGAWIKRRKYLSRVC
ncbi:MAG: PEP-CTERM sorting domain-containing protein [Planctomycetia bacterium]|nr:PEP-CTERM sorting domain-containing protein [Planctomycetia bacterium]